MLYARCCYMPLTDKGQKIMSSMMDTYGSKKGESVFYASKNAGKISGVDKSRGKSHGKKKFSRGGRATARRGR